MKKETSRNFLVWAIEDIDSILNWSFGSVSVQGHKEFRNFLNEAALLLTKALGYYDASGEFEPKTIGNITYLFIDPPEAKKNRTIIKFKRQERGRKLLCTQSNLVKRCLRMTSNWKRLCSG